MKSISSLLAPALLTAVVIGGAVPADAAPHRTGAGEDLRREISQLDRQVERMRQDRRISRREAAKIDARIDMLRNTWRDYARGGFDRGETRSLAANIEYVRRDLARQAFDRNDRPYNRRG